MGGSTGGGVNPFAGQPLSTNVNQAYTGALGQAGALSGAGATALDSANNWASTAGDLFKNLASGGVRDVSAMPVGYNNVSAGQVDPQNLGNTDLSAYMNPYTNNVIDSVLSRLRNEEGIAQQGVDDAALAQNSFDNSRMYLQKGVTSGKFADTKADALSKLLSANFGQAQDAAKYDISNRLGADQFNVGNRLNADLANQGAGIQTGLANASNNLSAQLANQGVDLSKLNLGAGGLKDIASLLSSAGINLTGLGSSNLGNLANMGFGWGQDLFKNNLAAGSLQQQQNQSILDAIKGQFNGAANAPANSINTLLAAILNPGGYGTQTSTTTTNPGPLGVASGVAGILGAL